MKFVWCCLTYFLLLQLILLMHYLNNYYFQHNMSYLLSFCHFYCCNFRHTFLPSPQEGLAPINLIVENELHRATPGGTGGVKTIGNYAAVSQTAYPSPPFLFVVHCHLFLHVLSVCFKFKNHQQFQTED